MYHTKASYKTTAKEMYKILATDQNTDPQSILLGISSRFTNDKYNVKLYMMTFWSCIGMCVYVFF